MTRKTGLVWLLLLFCTAVRASNLRQISSREGISNNAILSLAQDKHGFIWVGSCDGLNMWDGERMRLFPNDWGGETPLSGNLIEEIAVTTDSLFWIRTNYGLDLFDPDSKRVERHADFQGMYKIVTRRSNEVLVVTQDNKFRYYDPKTGNYISQDPIGLAGGNPTLYGYVFDPNTQIDPFGLDCGKKKITAIAPYYPPNDGALGKSKRIFLMPGDKVDRFGNDTGKYLSPKGTPFEMRALPPNNTGKYNVYEVIKPFEVEASTIAPAFGKIGLGTQYKTSVPIKILVKRGILKPV